MIAFVTLTVNVIFAGLVFRSLSLTLNVMLCIPAFRYVSRIPPYPIAPSISENHVTLSSSSESSMYRSGSSYSASKCISSVVVNSALCDGETSFLIIGGSLTLSIWILISTKSVLKFKSVTVILMETSGTSSFVGLKKT